MTPEEEAQLYDRLLDACLNLEGDRLRHAIAREIDLVPMSNSELTPRIEQARKMARLALAFQSAEASAAHEFGDDYDPGEEYRELRRKIIAGELTFEEAEAIDLARIQRDT